MAVRKDSVRAKIPCHNVKINLCGTIPFPCGNKSFRAAIFRFVRAKFNPCGVFDFSGKAKLKSRVISELTNQCCNVSIQ